MILFNRLYMQSIIYSLLATVFIFILFKLVDFYFPKKTTKKATILRKYTESYNVVTLDHAGNGHNVDMKRCLLTVLYTKNIQTETVNLDKYNRAAIGQKVYVVKLLSRFTNKLIKFELEL